jgi:SAM-dependent methyltransferase
MVGQTMQGVVQAITGQIAVGDPGAPIPATEEADLVGEYYSHLRTEIIARVPGHCLSVLSVGCGAAVTEGELVRLGKRVTGIEINPVAAEIARRRGVDVLVGDAGAVTEQLRDRRFDCLLYGDVLEHLPDPLSLLRCHEPLLSSGGVVVISVPNFRHYEVFLELFVRGHVRYADAGTLDRTHLRLTTRRMVEEWLGEIGLRRTSVEYLMPRRRDRLISRCSLHLLREFLARQVVVAGRKP